MADTIRSWTLTVSALIAALAFAGGVVKVYLDPPVCVAQMPAPLAKKK